MADYQRARSPQQKAERMSAIMDATETLFAQLPYHEINMGLIAKELGWSRSNLYKYAATQEEIFLALHSRANRALVDDLMASLAGKKLANAEFAREWACAVARHPEFLRYQSILIPIIETNTSLDRLVEFKKNFALMNESIRILLRKHLSCSANEASDLYLSLVYQAAALFNHFNCAEQVAEAMRIAGLPPIEGNFEDAYTSFVEMCLDRLSQ